MGTVLLWPKNLVQSPTCQDRTSPTSPSRAGLQSPKNMPMIGLCGHEVGRGGRERATVVPGNPMLGYECMSCHNRARWHKAMPPFEIAGVAVSFGVHCGIQKTTSRTKLNGSWSVWIPTFMSTAEHHAKSAAHVLFLGREWPMSTL